MTRTRPAFALPAALAAIIVLSGLAALASIAARVSLRESAALAAEAQSAATRAAVRARALRALTRTPRGELLAASRLIAERDTAVTAVALAWPWHRVTVAASGAAIVAELARATAPPLPWCAAVVFAGSSAIAPGTVSLDPASACTDLTRVATPVAIAALNDSIATSLVLASGADSATIYTGGAPTVYRASRIVVIAAGASVSGIVIAPEVRVQTGAAVNGIVIASSAVTISPGAAIIGDERTATAALHALAKLQLLGRAGLLLPP